MRFALIPAALILIFFFGATQAQQRASSSSSRSNVVQQAPTRILIPELELNNDRRGVENGVQTPTPIIIIPTALSSPTPPPTVAPAQPTETPELITNGATSQCQEVGCVVWTRPFVVDRTMNRWQVWEAYIGSGMMPWQQFSREAMTANPVLWNDGYMFKVGKQYLLPVCVDMEGH